MEDLAGIGKIAEVILDKVAAVTGTLYEPTKVRRLGRAQADVEAVLILKRTAVELESEDLRRRHQAELDINTLEPNLLRERAAHRLITQEIKRQENLEMIVHESLEGSGSGAAREIEDDWMEAFIQYAQNVSADGVRQLWAQILATQATEGKPAISRATLDALRLLEPKQAENFQRAIQLLIGMGQIMDVDPHGDPEVAFNVNALESLALEDIGFLKRIQEKEAGIGLVGSTFSFWDPHAQVLEGDPKKVFWNTGEYLREMVPRIKSLTAGERDLDGLRKETPIDRYILTSRGYELASILIDGFYDYLRAEDIPQVAALGRYAEQDTRERVRDYWAEQFNAKGAVVVFNETVKDQGGKSQLRPKLLFDDHKNEWVDITNYD